MLKEHGLSPEPTFGLFELPPKPNRVTDYAFGSTAINGNVGVRDKIWTFKYANGVISLINEDNISVKLVSGTYARELAGTFDKDMRPVVVWVGSGITRLYRYDTAVGDYVIDELGTGMLTPRATTDQRNLKYLPKRTYITYIKDNGLYIRTDEDNYQSEQGLAFFDKDYRIEQFGLSVVNRLRYRLYRLVMPEDLIVGDEIIEWSKTILSAVYDSGTQSIHCTGEVGDVFETYSSLNVLIGTGVIGSDGTITYPIDTSTLTNGEELTTKIVNKPNQFLHVYYLSPFEATIKNEWPDSPYQFRGGYSWYSDENPTLIVDWGDGSPIETITDGNPFRHDYASAQPYHRIKLWLGDTRLRELYFYDAETVHSWGGAEISAFILESRSLISVPNYLPTYVTGTYSMFKNCLLFNQNIGPWDVSRVTNMISMFSGAELFNQDLSVWCVSLIPSEPYDFSVYSPLTEAHKPRWGTCPLALDIDYSLLPYAVAKSMSQASNPPLDDEIQTALNLTYEVDPNDANAVIFKMTHDLNYPFTLVGIDGGSYSQPIIIRGFLRIKGAIYQDLVTRYNAGSNTIALEYQFGGDVQQLPVQVVYSNMGGIHYNGEMFLELFYRWPIFANATASDVGVPEIRWSWLSEQGEILFNKTFKTANEIDFFKLQNNFEENLISKKIVFDRTFTNTYFPYYRLLSNPYTTATHIDATSGFDQVLLDNSVNAYIIQDTNKLILDHQSGSEDFVIQFWMAGSFGGDLNITSGHVHEKQVYSNGIMFTIFIPKYVAPPPACTPTVLDMLTQEIPAVGDVYQYSYRVNGGPIQTTTENAGGNTAQPVFVNILGYYGLFPTLVDNGSHPGPRAFLAEYSSPIRGVGTDDPNLVTTETNTIEFLLTDGATHDLILTVFGGPITLYSCGTANFTG